MDLDITRDSDRPDFSRVKRCFGGKGGLLILKTSDNPILNTLLYEIQYPYGHKASLAANAIAENMFAQVDGEGNRNVLF